MPDPAEIAARRFELIRILLDPIIERAQRITKSTLYRWARLFREHGHEGLIPNSRKDLGASRSVNRSTWATYAIALLYEQPSRSLTVLGLYLRIEFEDYSWSRSALHRHVRRHPAFRGIESLRKGRKGKLRDRWEAAFPHEGWQLDGKGPFRVRFDDGTTVELHVLSIIECYSRVILAAVLAPAEDRKATIAVLEKAIARWGLPTRIQYDRGSAFDSHDVRHAIAQLGVHRGYSKPCSNSSTTRIATARSRCRRPLPRAESSCQTTQPASLPSHAFEPGGPDHQGWSRARAATLL